MYVSSRTFLAYSVLACWIGLTPVVIVTALQWSAQHVEYQLSLQRALDISEHRQTEAPSTAAELESELKSGIQVMKSANALTEKALDATRAAQIKREEFWWEFFVWVCLTLLGSALLAERGEKVNG